MVGAQFQRAGLRWATSAALVLSMALACSVEQGEDREAEHAAGAVFRSTNDWPAISERRACMKPMVIVLSALTLALLCLCGCAGAYVGGDMGGANGSTDTHGDVAATVRTAP